MFLTRCNPRVVIINYLDDFIFVASSAEECEDALQIFEHFCQDLNICIAHHKTIRATRDIVFLGLGIDAETLSLYISKKKGEKAISEEVKATSETVAIYDWYFEPPLASNISWKNLFKQHV